MQIILWYYITFKTILSIYFTKLFYYYIKLLTKKSFICIITKNIIDKKFIYHNFSKATK